MKRVTLLVVVSIAAALVAVGASAQSGTDPFSPGPVHSSHAEAECTDCHEPWRGATDQKCLECHEDVEDPATENGSIHEGFDAECSACHWEHEGPAADLTVEVRHSQFTGDCTDCHTDDLKENFLPGEHYDTDCGACHNTEDWTEISFDHDQTTADCVECHQETLNESFLPGEHYRDSCDDCHTTDDWNRIVFDHRDIFPLTGDHDIRECAECHPDSNDLEKWTCYNSCHEDHTRSGVEREHRGEVDPGADLDNCLECHPTGREDEAEEGEFGDFEEEDD